MWKKLSIAMMSVALMIGSANPSQADTVLEKVARTGILTIGTQTNLVPYSYVDDQGQLIGYTIDIINLIKKQLEAELGKEVTIQVVVNQTFADRITKLTYGEVDITCDAAFTWERDKVVDFSVSYSLSGIRLAVPKGSSLGSPESLRGKRIGVLQYTIGEQAIAKVQPQAKMIVFPTIEEGIEALEAGQVDAIAGDTVILSGLIATIDPDRFTISPPESFASYGFACMVPENNSGFLDLVNFAIVSMMQQYVNGDPATVERVNRWVGSDGIVEISPETVRTFFQAVILMREQVPPSSPQQETR